jgi:hypothetical protein
LSDFTYIYIFSSSSFAFFHQTRDICEMSRTSRCSHKKWMWKVWKLLPKCLSDFNVFVSSYGEHNGNVLINDDSMSYLNPQNPLQHSWNLISDFICLSSLVQHIKRKKKIRMKCNVQYVYSIRTDVYIPETEKKEQ